MRLKKIALLTFLPLALISLSACSLSFSNNKATSGVGVDNRTDIGGVIVSPDFGGKFVRYSSVPTVTGQISNINLLNTRFFVIDPSDSRAIYLASYDQGIYYTYDVTKGWNHFDNFPRATVGALAVNPQNKCELFASAANNLYQSKDCGRNWYIIYSDVDASTYLNAIAIDFYNPANIYLGNSNGDLLKSINNGKEWRTIKRLNNGISKINLSPQDSRKIYVLTANASLYSFVTNTDTNPGQSENIEANFAVNNWQDLNVVLKDLSIGKTAVSLTNMPDGKTIFLTTNSAIVRSPDSGITWEKLSLLPDDKDAIIRSVVIDPQNEKRIYYATNSTFFKSQDGGVTWSNKKLPTSRVGWAMAIDFINTNNIYLGFRKIN